ncbi:MAG: L,D-transpeptidase [Holophagaceae bacterium]
MPNDSHGEPPQARRQDRATFLLALLLILGACERKAPPPPAPQAAAPKPAAKPAPPPAPPAFTRIKLQAPKDLLELQARLGPDRSAEVLKLNRVDLAHARKGDSLVLPPEGVDWMALSPFPAAWPDVADQPKLLLVSLRLQAWAAYEGGRLVRWGPTSTGRKKSPTPIGLYHTNWCQKSRTSTFNDEWELTWYINIHNASGISMHQYELPGYPASHACARLAPDDAEWIWRWCASWKLTKDERKVLQEGTPVVVFGEYGFGRPKPWKEAPEHPEAARLAAVELAEALRVLKEAVVPELPDEDDAAGD